MSIPTEENTINKEEPVDSAQGKLKELELKCDEYLNNWKRAAADLINYKKDEMERMAFLGTYAKEAMVLKVLPIIDNFYLAAKEIPKEVKESTWGGGFIQIAKQIEDFLKKEGIEEIEVIGKPFNPEVMEIVEQVEGGESGIVAGELQKGYIINGKVLRPTKVKVTK